MIFLSPILSIALVCMVSFPSSAAIPGDSSKNVPSEGKFILDEFQVDLPKEVTVRSKKFVDFSVLAFKWRGKVLVSVYIGNASRFQAAIKGHEDEVFHESSGAVERQSLVCIKRGLRNRQTLIRRTDSGMAGQFHAWYKRLGPRDAEMGDRLIQSMRYDEGAVDRLKRLEASQSIEE